MSRMYIQDKNWSDRHHLLIFCTEISNYIWILSEDIKQSLLLRIFSNYVLHTFDIKSSTRPLSLFTWNYANCCCLDMFTHVTLFIFVSFFTAYYWSQIKWGGVRYILAEQSGMTTDHRQLFWQFQAHPWHCGTHIVKWCGGLLHHEPPTNA